jgi:hypothetical protein
MADTADQTKYEELIDAANTVLTHVEHDNMPRSRERRRSGMSAPHVLRRAVSPQDTPSADVHR